MNFEIFKANHRDYSSIIQDGVFCEETFNLQPKRILFVLKEANHRHDNDFRKYLLETNSNIWRTWNNIARWAQALLDGTDYVYYISQNERNSWLKKISFINLKKEGGQSCSKFVEPIIARAIDAAEFIKEQISEISPDIIICCGETQGTSNAKILHDYVLHDNSENWQKIDGTTYWYFEYPNEKKTPVVSFVHPQARGGHKKWRKLYDDILAIKSHLNI